MAHQATPSSQKALMMELKSLQEQPLEGFRITLVTESDLYNWQVAIFGPPNTLYEGGYFKVRFIWQIDQMSRCRRRWPGFEPLDCTSQVMKGVARNMLLTQMALSVFVSMPKKCNNVFFIPTPPT